MPSIPVRAGAVMAIDVLEVAESRNQGLFKLAFGCGPGHAGALVLLIVITAPARTGMLGIVVGHFWYA